ncbi:hypothetical protein ABT063_49080 [Streptomyces sp. NPDC002838]|uniref:hypothetical protein n=1 Tax=Streptomyces sp. NPDC002838 TaxID=3154436 RepID=UPI003317E828
MFTPGDALTAVAPALTVLPATRVLAGIGAGAYSPMAAATMANVADAERGGRSPA